MTPRGAAVLLAAFALAILLLLANRRPHPEQRASLDSPKSWCSPHTHNAVVNLLERHVESVMRPTDMTSTHASSLVKPQWYNDIAVSEFQKHMTATVAYLKGSAGCMATAYSLLKRGTKELGIGSLVKHKQEVIFIDLGARAGDQTLQFLSTYPRGASAEVHAFEPNAQFASLWEKPPLARFGTRFYNAAAGVANGTAALTNEATGSSIVAGRNGRANTTEVAVVDFAEFLLRTVHRRPNAKVVVKMDIEHMEFAVLHRMVRTGALLLVDELLLECHFTTKRRRAKGGNKRKNLRRPDNTEVARDDCSAFIAALNKHLNTMKAKVFEAVWWNEGEIGASETFSKTHGGFRPT